MSAMSDPPVSLTLIIVFLSFTPADSDANWIESLHRADVAQSKASDTLATPPSTQAPTSPPQAPDHATASTKPLSSSPFSANGEALDTGMSVHSYVDWVSYTPTGIRSQLKKLEEEKSALQLQLQQEQQRTQDTLRGIEVAIQETRSLDNMYRSSQAEILQLTSQLDELRRSYAELQAENMQSASNLMGSFSNSLFIVGQAMNGIQKNSMISAA